MINFKSLASINISKFSLGLFKHVSRDELFTKEEYELEISKMRKKLAKEMTDDIITERAKTINDAVKAITTIMTDEVDGFRTKDKIQEKLNVITETLFTNPTEDTKCECGCK